jgi:DNA-binding MarR family transcriptional regulator
LTREELVARFADPGDHRATLIDITGSGRARRPHLQRSAEDQNTLDLAMHAASRQINLLAQLAASHPPSFGNRSPSTN